MPITSGIFSADVNFNERRVTSLEELHALANHLKGIGLRVVLTSGSFDLVHLGHVKYLAKAKALGDVLVVGVDSDAKIRRRKGEDRPMVPEDERLEMLAHQRPVDVIYLKDEDDERWGLIRAVRPDVLVLTADHSYDDAELAQLHETCGQVEVLERQAAVTTSERIRQLYLHLGERLGPALADVLGERLGPVLTDVLPGLIDDIAKRR
ncbi:MAG TPA: adenylyltransferase/cytidyltransferase family protein [Conexibacter sp.]|nr:adenylyltransferase/cytidyltransferase family protein [Conexibacter sp.]